MPRSKDGRWTAICEVCGSEFQQKRPGIRTCGVKCRAQLPHNTGGFRAKAGLEPRQCQNPDCRKTYQPIRDHQVACSRECSLRTPQHRAAQREYDIRPERRAAQNRSRNLATTRDPVRRKAENFRQNLRKYGITPEQFEAMMEAQGGVCILCGLPPNPDGVRAASRLHVDHDHVTGRNRDLLCSRCNAALGLLQDNPALLRMAADYIERHRAAAGLLQDDPALLRAAADYIERHEAMAEES